MPAARHWSDADLAMLRSNWNVITRDDLAGLLNRSRSAVYTKAAELGLPPAREMRPWTTKELTFIREQRGALTALEIARQLGRTEGAVVQMIIKQGLSKTRLWSAADRHAVKIEAAMAVQRLQQRLGFREGAVKRMLAAELSRRIRRPQA